MRNIKSDNRNHSRALSPLWLQYKTIPFLKQYEKRNKKTIICYIRSIVISLSNL